MYEVANLTKDSQLGRVVNGVTKRKKRKNWRTDAETITERPNPRRSKSNIQIRGLKDGLPR